MFETSYGSDCNTQHLHSLARPTEPSASAIKVAGNALFNKEGVIYNGSLKLPPLVSFDLPNGKGDIYTITKAINFVISTRIDDIHFVGNSGDIHGHHSMIEVGLRPFHVHVQGFPVEQGHLIGPGGTWVVLYTIIRS